MAVKLNGPGLTYAKSLIRAGDFDAEGAWSFDAADGDAILGDPPDWARYRKHHLGFDDEADAETKAAYRYPFAKRVAGRTKLFRAALRAIRSRAAQEGQDDIFDAAGKCMELMDSMMEEDEEAKTLLPPELRERRQVRVFDRASGRELDPILLGPVRRGGSLRDAVVDLEAGIIRNVSFSSEFPVERWWGIEILDHDPSSVRMERFAAGLPFTVNHAVDRHVGVVENAKVGKKRLVGDVRFSKSASAREILQDIADGIRPNTSIWYHIHKAEVEKGQEAETDGDKATPTTYRITDWEPLETTSATVPADFTVGVGRADPSRAIGGEPPTSPGEASRSVATDGDTPAPAAPRIEIEPKREEGTMDPQEVAKRVARILATGKQLGIEDFARDFVAGGGHDDTAFSQLALEELGKRANATPTPPSPEKSMIGMKPRDLDRYSFRRAILAAFPGADRRTREEAAFELECSDGAYRKAVEAGVSPNGMLVPLDVLHSPGFLGRNGRRAVTERRDLTAETSGAGAELVATDLLAGNFIDVLRPFSGGVPRATVLSGLQGKVAIPRQTTTPAAAWKAEAAAAGEGTQAFDQVTMDPKRLPHFTEYTKQLLVQASLDVEALVRRDLGIGLVIVLDNATLNGATAGDNPVGVRFTTGIGDVNMGANGGAPTWPFMVEFETDVLGQNALFGDCAYIINAPTLGKLKTTEKASSTAQFLLDGRIMNGYPVLVTNQLPSNLTKGTGTNLSAMVFGNWADLLIGFWGGLDIVVNPYSRDTEGIVRITVTMFADVGIRHPASFSASDEVITA